MVITAYGVTKAALRIIGDFYLAIMVYTGVVADLGKKNKPAVPVGPVNIITGQIGVENRIPAEQRLTVCHAYFEVFRRRGREINQSGHD